MSEKVDRLVLAAQKLAEQTPRFFETKGPGAGDHAANRFMGELQELGRRLFAKDYSERKIRKDLQFRFDFFFPDEATVVEIALSLDKPQTELEKDIFKCLLAREAGLQIQRLVLVAKPGGEDRQATRGQKAIRDFVGRNFGLKIEVHELVPLGD